MPSKIFIANWKMNLSNAKAIDYFVKFKNPQPKKAKTIVAAPFTFLPALSVMKQKDLILGAQNVNDHPQGAYTGEISATMLKEVGVRYCLVGHSERRIYFQETNQMILSKITQLLAKNITPVFCFGEDAKAKAQGQTKKVLTQQLRSVLKGLSTPQRVLFAYEPVWAISTFQKNKIKKTANIEDIIETHNFIKSFIKKNYKNPIKIKLLYGGSVNPQNAQDIVNLEVVDGVLVGSASLKPISFVQIINSLN